MLAAGEQPAISYAMTGVALVDAHLHLWDPARLEYAWLAEVPSIAGRHGLAELLRDGGAAELEAAVFVQCDCRPDQDEAEVEWVSSLAREQPLLRGIVAGIRLEKGPAVRPQLERYASNPLVKGVRRLIQSERDPRFCLQETFIEGVRALADHAFTFDLCIRHHQLPAATELVRSAPGVEFVLDHLGKPDVRARSIEPWRRDLASLAREPNVSCKLSGLVTEADPERWSTADLAPYVEHALDCFGAERLMFGSDWPVVRLAGGRSCWVESLRTMLQELTIDERDRIWRANARRIYRLDRALGASGS